MADKYKAQARCSNCGWHGKVELEKGTRIEDSACPCCGCISSKRDDSRRQSK